MVRYLKELYWALFVPDWVKITKQRATNIEAFVWNCLCSKEHWGGTPTVVNGKVNFYVGPDNQLPQIDYLFFNRPLVMLVGDIGSAEWADAKQLGISRNKWLEYNTKWVVKFDLMNTYCLQHSIDFIVIPWDTNTATANLKLLFQQNKLI